MLRGAPPSRMFSLHQLDSIMNSWAYNRRKYFVYLKEIFLPEQRVSDKKKKKIRKHTKWRWKWSLEDQEQTNDCLSETILVCSCYFFPTCKVPCHKPKAEFPGIFNNWYFLQSFWTHRDFSSFFFKEKDKRKGWLLHLVTDTAGRQLRNMKPIPTDPHQKRYHGVSRG